MANVVSEEKKQQVLGLGRLGWPLRRIEEETGIRRETASRYLKAAGILIRSPGGWGRRPPPKAAKEALTDSESAAGAEPAKEVHTDSGPGIGAKPANEVSTDSASGSAAAPWPPEPTRSPRLSRSEPYREIIERGLALGRNGMAIWQDLVSDHGFSASYASVQRYVRKLAGEKTPEARAIILTAPGEEGQIDYGDGPMVRDAGSGKYRRVRLFEPALVYFHGNGMAAALRRHAAAPRAVFRRSGADGGYGATQARDRVSRHRELHSAYRNRWRLVSRGRDRGGAFGGPGVVSRSSPVPRGKERVVRTSRWSYYAGIPFRAVARALGDVLCARPLSTAGFRR